MRLNEPELASYFREIGYQPTTPNIQEIIQKESWRDIHEDFDYLIRKKWEEKGFSAEKVQD